MLGNAAKFTPVDGRIELQSYIDVDRIVVSVADNGKGIAPEVLPRLFHAFEQGSADVTRSFGGLGLGLSIAKALVVMHGGSLTATSAGEGKGAQFLVILPLSHFPPTSTSSIEPAKPSIAPPAPELSPPRKSAAEGARILLVEDNAATAAILQRLLTKHRYEWRTAGTVVEALTMARSADFEVLICDVGLPDGSGIEVVTEMRTLQPACKVVTLSGYGTTEDVEKSLKAGASVHLTKPVRCAELATTIARLLVPST